MGASLNIILALLEKAAGAIPLPIPTWAIKLGAKLIGNLLIKGYTSIAQYLDRQADKKEQKNDLEKASKIKDRRARVASMAAAVKSYQRM